MRAHHLAAGAADDIAAEEKAHGSRFLLSAFSHQLSAFGGSHHADR
jgi:hypothetical protein